MKYKSYPEYKESGIQWIGEIPEEWAIRKFSSFGFFSSSGINKKTESNEPLVKMVNYTDIYGNDSLVIDSKRDLMIVSCHREKIIFCNLKKGDIVFTPSSETEEDIGLSAAIFENLKNTVFSYHVIKFRTIIKINLYYKKYIGNNHFVLSQFSRICKGTTRKILTHNDFNIILTLLPPLQEQAIIANFLDKKTAEIDKLIEKDKKLIELLKEKRTVLINHVITKGLPVRRTQTGLDPNVKMKDSGIEWIGEIPEGWEVRRLRFNALVNPSGKKVLSNPKTLVNFLPMEKVSEDGEYENESEIEYQNVSTGYTYFENNDVLVAKITPCFENGKGTLVNNLKVGFGFGTTEFHIIRSYWHLIPRYLFYLTKTHLFRVTGEAFMKGTAGQKRISADFVKDFMMVTPPKIEQLEIVRHLDKATAKIDKTIQKIEQKIELLEEYKKSLIHHTITGKIDVREVKA